MSAERQSISGDRALVVSMIVSGILYFGGIFSTDEKLAKLEQILKHQAEPDTACHCQKGRHDDAEYVCDSSSGVSAGSTAKTKASSEYVGTPSRVFRSGEQCTNSKADRGHVEFPNRQRVPQSVPAPIVAQGGAL